MVSEAVVFKQFENIRIGHYKQKRAPHKPLLLLWAIARCLRGESRLVSFNLVNKDLSNLIYLFGPHGLKQNTHLPFWYLQNDDIWELDRPELVHKNERNRPRKTDLINHNILGGLTISAHRCVQNNPLRARLFAESLIARHFPPSLYEEVFDAVRFPLYQFHNEESEFSVRWSVTRHRARDRTFRASVLSAYSSTCAVCELSVRQQGTSRALAIEAAHIKWHAYEGPPKVENGIALCALHHSLFDKGAFTVHPDLRVLVSPDMEGDGLDQVLGQYDSKCLRVLPSIDASRPNGEYLLWHGKQVFKSPRLLDSV